MKRILSLLLFIGMANIISAQGVAHYGKTIDESNAITMEELVKKMENKEKMEVKVKGSVIECCQMKGCWMTMDKGDGTTMRVKFKDYAFFVPKNSSGKTAILQGTAAVEITPVDELRHYAEDAGKSKEEIESIKEPARELVFEAEGVILK